MVNMLRRSATGTDLAANMAVQLDIVSRSTLDGSTTVALPLLLAALKEMVHGDANGAVAQWLMAELIKRESEVSALDRHDFFSYAHPENGALVSSIGRDALLLLELSPETWIRPTTSKTWYHLSDLRATLRVVEQDGV